MGVEQNRPMFDAGRGEAGGVGGDGEVGGGDELAAGGGGDAVDLGDDRLGAGGRCAASGGSRGRRRLRRPGGSGLARISRRSWPAQKAGPLAARMTTWIVGSAAMAASAASRASIRASGQGVAGGGTVQRQGRDVVAVVAEEDIGHDAVWIAEGCA